MKKHISFQYNVKNAIFSCELWKVIFALFLRSSRNSESGALFALIHDRRERRSRRAHEIESGAQSAAHMSAAL